MPRLHQYTTSIRWTGNTGQGTSSYRTYERAHEIHVQGKPPIPGSSDPAFCGDPARYNPEELLVAALSGCHMLWYLHLCAVRGIVVVDYVDTAAGTMEEAADGSGHFTGVVLKPHTKIAAGDVKLAEELHVVANKMCFIA